jgi:hypothetical protein
MTQDRPTRPYDPEYVRSRVRELAAKGWQGLATPGLAGLCVGTLESLFDDKDRAIRAAKRHTMTTYLIGKGSSKEWTAGEANAMLKWCADRECAPLEAERIVLLYEATHGQQQLL